MPMLNPMLDDKVLDSEAVETKNSSPEQTVLLGLDYGVKKWEWPWAILSLKMLVHLIYWL